MKRLIGFALAVFVAGCAGVGYVATSDPNEKLQQAYALISQDRPVLAEDIIRQALSIFEKRNDKLGMAESYFAFGNLYVSDSYRNNSVTFKKLGTYDGTYMKAIQALMRGRELFAAAGSEVGVVKSDATLGNTYVARSNVPKACTYYVKALSEYRAGKKAGTITKDPQITVKGYGNMQKILESYVAYYKCST